MADEPQRTLGDRFSRVVAPPELYDAKRRQAWRLEDDAGRGPYIIEFNLQHIGGLPGARAALNELKKDLKEAGYDLPGEVPIAKTYCRWDLRVKEWQELLARDQQQATDKATQSDTDPMHYKAAP